MKKLNHLISSRLFTSSSLFLALGFSALTTPHSTAQSIYEPYIFGTLAGGFSGPSGVAVDETGTVYVADMDNGTIRKVTATGVTSTLAGMAGMHGSDDGAGSTARFSNPRALAVDTAGNVYVADSDNSTIRKISPDGIVTTLAGLAGNWDRYADGKGSAARFWSPSGVAVDSSGIIYVADTANQTIRKVTPDGVVTTLAGSPRSGGNVDGVGRGAQFLYPSGIAVDNAGNVYVADTRNNRIRKINPAGRVTTLAGASYSQFETPNNRSIDGPGSLATFDTPLALTVDALGNVYVADTENDAIRKVTPSGSVTTLARTSGSGADRTEAGAGFSWPSGVALDSSGNVYVGDRRNNVIRKGFARGTLQFGVQDYHVVEGASVSIIVTLAGVFTNAVTVDYATSNGVARAGADYIATNGTLTFLPGQAIARFNVQTLADSIAEGSESFAINLSNPQGAPLAPFTSTAVTITDKDYFSMAPTSVEVDENAGTVKLTIVRQGNVSAPNSVSYSTFDGSAQGGVDYSPQAGVLDFGALETEKSIIISILDNGRLDGDRAFALRLINGTNVLSQTQITIHDDEKPAPTPYTFVTLAGEARYGSEDGPGGTARFNQSRGVAIDKAGTLYVADTGNHLIRKVTTGGLVTTLAGLAGTPGNSDGAGRSARFYYPAAIALDSKGDLYVADSWNNTIRKVTSEGVVTTFAGSATGSGSDDGTGSMARFSRPAGIALDSVGNVYVADGANQTIRKITPRGDVTTLAGEQGAGGVNDGLGTEASFYFAGGRKTTFSVGMAVDSMNNLYVADWNGSIRKVTPAGLVTTVASPQSNFSGPAGLALDVAGDLYVAYASSQVIQKIASDGSVATLAGLEGGAGSADGKRDVARFNYPSGLAVNSDGTVYVADTANGAIRKLAPDGLVTTLAGKAVDFSIADYDAVGRNARFWGPESVAVDTFGNLLVAEPNNNVIRKVTPGGVVTTLAGLPGKSGSDDGVGGDARFNGPGGVALDQAGNLYVADSGNNTIRRVTPAGVVTTLAGLSQDRGYVDGTGSVARFSNPRAIAIGHNGAIYVVDEGNGQIRIVTPAGIVTTLPAKEVQVYFYSGLTIDAQDNLYVSDARNIIRKITPEGSVTTLGGPPLDTSGDSPVNGSADGKGNAARFNGPSGIAVDHSGNVFVVDSKNNLIRRVTPDGVVTTLAGLAGSSGSADGTGGNARFGTVFEDDWFGTQRQGPRGIAVDSEGNLYVTDTPNGTIRKGYPVPRFSDLHQTPGATGREFGFVLTTPAGGAAVIEASTDLVHWLPVWTNTFAGSLSFSDSQSGGSTHRFYRSRTP